MQCKQCGADIPNGDVFCPKCGKEVQLVPDYNSVEYMIQQKKVAEELKQKEERDRLKKMIRTEKKTAEQKRKRRRKILWITILVIVLMASIAVGAVLFIRYSQDHSYEYQYQTAYDAYHETDYDTALVYAKRALELHPTSDNALLLLAESYLHKGETNTGIECLMQYIEVHPDSVDAYARIINAYADENRLDDIRILFESCNNDVILNEFVSYIPSEIQFVTAPGDYTDKISVELSCDNGTIYYTLDGTLPDKNSDVYTEPIALAEGTTNIQAICYSQSDIPGTVVSAEYTMTLAIPDPPFISPSSGEYEDGTEITVIVPEGCKAYYAFDSIASDSDNLYKGPVEMPKGEHIFSVIVIDKNDKQSYPASETYVVE